MKCLPIRAIRKFMTRLSPHSPCWDSHKPHHKGSGCHTERGACRPGRESDQAGPEAIVRAVHETRNTDNADFGEILFRIRIVCVPIHITSLPPVPAFCGLQTLFSSSLLSYLYGFAPCRTGCAPTPSILQSPYGHWVA